MLLGEISGEILGGLVRFVGGLVAEVVLEIAIRGPGYLIGRLFKKDIDPDGGWVVLIGIAFWVFVGVVGYFSYAHVSEHMVIDRCLDSGGKFNYQAQECVHD